MRRFSTTRPSHQLESHDTRSVPPSLYSISRTASVQLASPHKHAIKEQTLLRRVYDSLVRSLEDGALSLNIAGVKLLATLHAHLGGEGGAWLPLGRGTRGGLLEHLVDLLKSKALQKVVSK